MLALLAGLVGFGGSASAQIVTDGTLGSGGAIIPAGNVYSISQSLGATFGDNLFHSFSTFDVPTGYEAQFMGSADLANVIARVTGGEVSDIDGVIRVVGTAGANFFLINPAGVAFTSGARVDVPGGFYVSTANVLTFADGSAFPAAAITPSGALSMAAPASFGFVGGNGDISIDGALPQFMVRQSPLHMSADTVSIANSDFPAGALAIFALGGQAGDIDLRGPLPRDLSGAINIVHSNLLTFSTPEHNGHVALGAGSLFLVDSQFQTVANGAEDAGDIRVGARDVLLLRSRLGSFTNNAGEAGDVIVRAEAIDVDGSRILSDVAVGASGNGGTIVLAAPDIVLHSSDPARISSISASTRGGGDAGRIILRGQNLVFDHSEVASDTLPGAIGAGGRIEVWAHDMVVRNGGQISASVVSQGDGGDIALHVKGRLLLDQGFLTTQVISGGVSSPAYGDGGDISVSAHEIDIVHGGRISASSFVSGDAGNIDVTAHAITIDGADSVITPGIFAFTQAESAGGDIVIHADQIDLANGAEINATTASSLSAGDITIIADEMRIDQSQLIAATFGAGGGGALSLDIDDLSLSNGALISAEAFGAGAAGSINIDALAVSLSGASAIASTTHSDGAAGALNIGTASLTLDQSLISSGVDLGAHGAGGTITIGADDIQLANGAAINASSLGAGDAGDVILDTTSLVLNSASMITSNTGASGDGGSIIIQTQSFEASNASFIDASALSGSAGEGGDIDISADLIELDDAAISAATAGSGDAGDVAIVIRALALRNGALISTSTLAEGDAGSVTLDAAEIDLNDSRIASSADIGASGASGHIDIVADDVALTNAASIETSSANTLAAGAIAIKARDIVLDGPGSQIASVNTSLDAGAAGSITLTIDPITLTNGAAITTDSASGDAGDINLIFVNGGYVLLRDGAITTSSPTLNGGRINIFGADAIITQGGTIEALGPGGAAYVDIDALHYIADAAFSNVLRVDGVLTLDSDVSDVSQGAQTVDIPFLDVSRVLRGQCPATRQIGSSQLSAPANSLYQTGADEQLNAGLRTRASCMQAAYPRTH